MSRLIPSLALAALVVLAACGGDAAGDTTTTTLPPAPTVDPDTLEEYRSEDLGFAIGYPDGWTVEEEPQIVTFTAPSPEAGGFTPNFNVAVGDVPDDLPAAAYYEGERGRLEERLDGIEILEEADVQIDEGVVGRGITLTARLAEGTRVGIARLLVLHEGTAWEVSFFVPEDLLDDRSGLIRAVLQSFELTG